MRELLDRGADVRLTDTDGDTALHISALRGHVSGVSLLLDAGAAVDEPNHKTFTPLAYALSQGQYETSKALLQRGARVDCRDANGNTPLLLAAKVGDARTLDIVLKHPRVNLQETDRDRCSALFLALMGGNKDCIMSLLKAGADVNAVYEGKTPLMYACGRGMTDIVKELLAHKADVNHKSSADKGTPLHYACFSGSVQVLQLLMDAGADTQEAGGMHVGTLFVTPIQIALAMERKPLLRALIGAGAEVTSTDTVFAQTEGTRALVESYGMHNAKAC